MGLTIHYHGRFRKGASLPDMIDEVKDVAEAYNWNYHIFKREFPENSFGKETFDENIYGILFSPPRCEPVVLCFLSNGMMGNPFMLEYYLKTKLEDEKEFVYGNFTKTQYAGVEIHKIIIHFLRYINGKYLEDFQLTDEGQYWETGDEKLLEKIFSEYTALIDGFADALENNKVQEGETLENFLIRIAKMVHGRKK